ncbi:acetylcholine receptor subunit alpha-1-A-like, partial [Babylonia areolata]|uniref:acetylcholine receptor subunit alpha-1-A-like n=1 Tax=Babylonia areolata TaxID=304850 RepID=UPI003FD5854C
SHACTNALKNIDPHIHTNTHIHTRTEAATDWPQEGWEKISDAKNVASSVLLSLLYLEKPTETLFRFEESALNLSKLHDDLPKLTSEIRPVKDLTQPTVVNISFHLISIISLDMVSQKLVSNGWMSVAWQTDYMTWDPADYGGIWSINPPTEQMWRPRVTVQNTMKELKAIGEEYVVIDLHSSGLVIWYPAERFETFCHIDVTFFPFDFQRCTWQLFVWGQLMNEVIMQPELPNIHLDTYTGNGEWNLISSRAWSDVAVTGPHSYSLLYYEVTLRRRPTLLALTVIMPVFVLSVTNVFVFSIPSEAGERLAYAMTSFLSFGVFMSFIVDLMPSATETLSIMAVSMSCQLILSAVFVLFCILSLKLFHRDPHKHPVPPTLRTLIVGLELLLCLDPPSRHPVNSTQTHLEVISSDKSGDFYGEAEVKGSRLQGHLARWARKRKVREEAYTQPQDMTWQRVSRSLDKLLFRFFFCLQVIGTVILFPIMIYHYFSSA